MKVEIKEKLSTKLQELHPDYIIKFEEQDDFFCYYTIPKEDITIQYRVYKFIINHEDGLYQFTTQKDNIDTHTWNNAGKVSVPAERLDDESSDCWKDPEPIRHSSLQGLRIRLHQAHKITNNIYKSFYLVSNEIYHTTLDAISWFEDKKEDKHHQHIMAYNTLKMFQAFEVFKEDLANDSKAVKTKISMNVLLKNKQKNNYSYSVNAQHTKKKQRTLSLQGSLFLFFSSTYISNLYRFVIFPLVSNMF